MKLIYGMLLTAAGALTATASFAQNPPNECNRECGLAILAELRAIKADSAALRAKVDAVAATAGKKSALPVDGVFLTGSLGNLSLASHVNAYCAGLGYRAGRAVSVNNARPPANLNFSDTRVNLICHD